MLYLCIFYSIGMTEKADEHFEVKTSQQGIKKNLHGVSVLNSEVF